MDNMTVSKGALGLMMWRLAQAGTSFELTYGNSADGDIWIRQPSGILQRMEVKGSRSHCWRMRLSQMKRVDCVAFVCVDDGATWVLPIKQVLSLSKHIHAGASGDVATITGAMLPHDAQNNVPMVGTTKRRNKPRAKTTQHEQPIDAPPTGANGIVRRMASGEVRKYFYARPNGGSLGYMVLCTAPLAKDAKENLSA